MTQEDMIKHRALIERGIEDNKITFFSAEDIEARFNVCLDDDSVVKIMGLEYMPSEVLRCVDPTAYREGLLNFIDAEGLDEFDGGYVLGEEVRDYIAEHIE